MAMILKEGIEKWQCPHGINHKNPYAVVDMVRGNKIKRQQSIRFDIFRNENKRKNGFELLQSFEYTVIEREFVEWFSVAAMSKDGNVYKQAYLYLHQLKNEEDELVWEDWESDEGGE